MKSNRLFIVAPVYFDFESFIILRSEIVKQLKNFSINLEPRFVAVDDSAGEDCAVNELEKLEDVIVLKPPFNLGHQRAIVFGIRSCFNLLQDTDFLVTLDSDGEDRPEDLPNMLLLMQKKQEPLVLARRTERQESLSFKICYLFYKFFFIPVGWGQYYLANFSGIIDGFIRVPFGEEDYNVCKKYNKDVLL